LVVDLYAIAHAFSKRNYIIDNTLALNLEQIIIPNNPKALLSSPLSNIHNSFHTFYLQMAMVRTITLIYKYKSINLKQASRMSYVDQVFSIKEIKETEYIA
jgi:hypothetical protein